MSRAAKRALLTLACLGAAALTANGASAKPATGYTDPAAFRRVFKQATGLSPGRYRDAYGLRNGRGS